MNLISVKLLKFFYIINLLLQNFLSDIIFQGQYIELPCELYTTKNTCNIQVFTSLFAMTSCLFYLYKVQLAMQPLLQRVFRIFIDSIYDCLCAQNKSCLFLVVRTVSKREFYYNLVSGAISPRSPMTKNEVLIHVVRK